MSRQIVLWRLISDANAEAAPLRRPTFVTAAGPRLAPSSERPSSLAVVITPLRNGGTGALMFVPDNSSERVLCNDTPLSGGVYSLHHADRIVLADATYWISETGPPHQTTYDPSLHGEGMYCARTRVRLEPGAAIVICPGTAVDPCELIFTQTAWEMNVPCPHCRFDPKAPLWSPPFPKSQKVLHELLRLANPGD